MCEDPRSLRSAQWFSGREELAFQNRSALRSMGLNPDDGILFRVVSQGAVEDFGPDDGLFQLFGVAP